MLLELAIGDAYGAAFEYSKTEFVDKHNHLKGYSKHPKHNIEPGCYTDDAQMSIANTEVILEGTITQALLAEAYVSCFKRDQREGYAGRFYKFLCDVKDGPDFLAKIQPDSDKSGAAMRALPFGIYPLKMLKDLASMQAKITHNTPKGIDSAIAAALMSHYFFYNCGPKNRLGDFIQTHVPSVEWAKPWVGPVGSKGVMIVRAAISTVVQYDSMSEILWECIDFTGDVDTVAALALGAASLSNEVEQDLPKVLINTLENGKYGREYIESLDQKLKDKLVKVS
jgi:ADP-ribosyl-[dinitrogen reductase] hydrolase